jgi:hypothetical protein
MKGAWLEIWGKHRIIDFISVPEETSPVISEYPSFGELADDGPTDLGTDFS